MRNYSVCMATIIFFGIGAVQGESIYIAQTAQGSDNGAGAATAHAAAWFNTAANWGTGAGKIGPGDTVRLCGIVTTSLTIYGSGSAGHSITILFESGAKLSNPFWGLESNGAIASNNHSYINLDGGTNGLIENTSNGDGLSNQKPSTGIYLANGSNYWTIKNISIRNIFKHVYNTNNVLSSYTTQGIEVSNCANLLISGCSIKSAYVGIYAFTEGSEAISNINISSNTIDSCSTGIIIALGASNSSMDSVNIFNNDITMGNNWFDTPDDNHIDGIHCWTSSNGTITNLSAYSNYFHGNPSGHNTGDIFLEGAITNPLIYNNLLIGNTTKPTDGYIVLGLSSGHPRIYNNTIVGLGTASSGGIGVSAAGTAFEAKNNIISSCFMGIYDAGQTVGTWECDYNDFYSLGYVGGSSSFYSTLANWQTYSGGDAHSINTNPNLDGSYKLQVTSPCLNTGASLSSYFTTDKIGVVRPQGLAWDIGAYEYVAGTAIAPSAPNRQLPSQTNIRLGNTSFSVTFPASARSPELTIFDLAGRELYRAILNKSGESVYNCAWHGAPAGIYFALVKEPSRNDGAVLARTKFVVGR